jgi:LacI family transcriptional regulator
VVTIKDIAKKAKISVTTVSRALNDFDDVNTETKKKIKKIAKEMGYAPNRMARGLVKKDKRTLALVLSNLEKEGGKDNIVYRIMSGMYKFADSVNFEIVIFTTNSAHQKETTYTQFCHGHDIGGAIMLGIQIDDPYFKEIINNDIPVVLIDIEGYGDKVSSVLIDNTEASREAVEFLIKNNHTNIAMLTGRPNADVSIPRQSGYEKALTNAKIEINLDYIKCGFFLEKEAYIETKKLIETHPEITAIFCASDMMACGAYRAIRELGKSIPKDISIIGFDDNPLAEYLSPSLTTIRQDFYNKGYKAAEVLYKMIKGEAESHRVVQDHKLILRDSVAKARI